MADYSEFGRMCAEIKYGQGKTWKETANIVDETKGKTRSAGRRFKNKYGLPPYTQLDLQDDSDKLPDQETRIKKKERQNVLVVYASGAKIASADELMDHIGLSRDEWTYHEQEVIKWAVGSNAEQKHLSFDDGKISGTIDSDGLTVAPLFRVKARFYRIDPKPIAPTVRPIVAPSTFFDEWPERPAKKNAGIARHLVLADPHFGFRRNIRNGKLIPFHDRRCLDIAVQIARLAAVDEISVVGDILDLPNFSTRFLKEPEFRFTLQPALNEAHLWLGRLAQTLPRLMPGRKKVKLFLHEGNHDHRIKRYLIKHFEAMYDIRAADKLKLPPCVSVPNMLGLDSIGATWIDNYPDDLRWVSDDMKFKHGNLSRKAPGATAKAVAQECATSTAFGHSHRLELVSRTIWGGSNPRFTRTICVACLCHLDGRVPGSSSESNWQNGLALVDIHKSGLKQITPVFIEDGKALHDGMHLVGESNQEELRQKWPEYNW